MDKLSPEEDQDDHEEEERMQEADNQRLALRMRIECVGRRGKVERSYFVRKCPSSGTSELRIQSWKEVYVVLLLLVSLNLIRRRWMNCVGLWRKLSSTLLIRTSLMV